MAKLQSPTSEGGGGVHRRRMGAVSRCAWAERDRELASLMRKSIRDDNGIGKWHERKRRQKSAA